jgi:hypothetical protein
MQNVTFSSNDIAVYFWLSKSVATFECNQCVFEENRYGAVWVDAITVCLSLSVSCFDLLPLFPL